MAGPSLAKIATPLLIVILAVVSTISLIALCKVTAQEHQREKCTTRRSYLGEEDQDTLYDTHIISNENTLEDDQEMDDALDSLDTKSFKHERVLHYKRATAGADGGWELTAGASHAEKLGAEAEDGAAVFTDTNLETDSVCHAHSLSEYNGHSVIKWGAENILETAGDCCTACTINPSCNVWVFCPEVRGCNGHKHGECRLKKATLSSLMEANDNTQGTVLWVSGAIYNDVDKASFEDVGKTRLAVLANDPDLPLVFLDVAIKERIIGRIKIVLFMKDAPRAAENFRALCTGEKGVVPIRRDGAGRPYHFKGAAFYRIVDGFIDQSGANTDSVYGGTFKDDPGGLALKHDRKGLLSMATSGPDTSTSHFCIFLAPAPHLDKQYPIFGEVVGGFEVAQEINALSRGKPSHVAGLDDKAVIFDCGQLR